MKTTLFLVALALLCLFVTQIVWAQDPTTKEKHEILREIWKNDPELPLNQVTKYAKIKFKEKGLPPFDYKTEKQSDKVVRGTSMSSNQATLTSTASEGEVPDAIEYAALVALYYNTNGTGWINNTGWLQGTTSQDFDNWYGVEISNNDVVWLSLHNNNLQGVLPSEIGTLLKLRELNLESNNISGSIPESIGNLINLVDLELWENDLSGSIPSTIRNLTNLNFLHLHDNNLTGTIPSEIWSLPELIGLELSNNNLVGSLPSDIGNLYLFGLGLANNNFYGNLPPELGNMYGLTGLYIENNNFTGELPAGLAQNEYLVQLHLDNNQLSGTIPQSMGSYYVNITMQNNFYTFSAIEPFLTGPDQHSLSEFVYAPQKEIGGGSSVLVSQGSALTLSHQTTTSNSQYQWQKQINGAWSDITGATQPALDISSAQPGDAGLYRCVITNTWATQLTLYTHIFAVEVVEPYVAGQDEQAMTDFYNTITNTSNLPSSWDPSRPISEWEGVTVVNGRVTKITLNNKGLQGSIPEAFSKLTGLQELDLGNNQLTGTIPASLGKLTNLKVLKLDKNDLEGEIPLQLGNLTNLDFLYLNENQLTGSIPSTLGNLSHLQVLNLGANQLGGSLPGELGNLGNLGHLFLGGNLLEGDLPPEYTNLLKLERFDVSNNNLSGVIPGWLGNLKKVYLLGLGGNQLSGPISPAIGEMTSLKDLQLYRNQLSGNVPASIGKLQNLENLHLYDNQLSGSLPDNLTYLGKLKQVRIHQNEITCIPDFSRLSLLDKLEVTNNRLTFGYLIPNRNVRGFSFSPQKQVGVPQNLNVISCQSYPLNLGFDGFVSTNKYEWYRNNNSLITNNSNSLQLDIQDIIQDNLYGNYYAKVTNPLFPGFTLTTRTISLTNRLISPCENEQNNYNYVKSETIIAKGNKSESSLKYLNNDKLNAQYEYIDGLGRAMQQVDKGASPVGNDVVQIVEYDAMGREVKKYLPYATSDQSGDYRTDFPTKQPAFYLGSGDKIADTNKPFSVTIFDDSPLNRVIEQGASGTDWQPTNPGDTTNKTIKYTYRTNKEDEVRKWIYDYTSQSITSESFYAYEEDTEDPGKYKGELYVTETKDEHNHDVWEYKDKLDRVVLKQVEGVDENGTDKALLTYYIYDDWGNLRVVIPPKAAATLPITGSVTKNLSDVFITEGCFTYDYDARQRMVSKQVPGAEPVWMIYDQRDRLVLTQDGEQRKDGAKQWTFTKYDKLNRPIMTGIYVHSTDYQNGPSGMQNDMNAKSFTEQYTGASNNFGYSDTGFPKIISNSNVTLLTVTYHDNYNFKTDINSQFGSAFDFQDVSSYDNIAQYPTTHFNRVQGKVTGSLVRVLDTNDWLKSVNYYDDQYQIIQTISENYPQGSDIVTTEYDLAGRAIRTLRVHHGYTPYSPLAIHKRNDYDHAGRIEKVYYKLNNEVPILLASYKYNELGEMVEKNLHEKSDGNFLQSIDYRYNERGWMTHINTSDLSNDNDKNDDDDDLFGMRFYYQDTPEDESYPQYNGNISYVQWTNQTGKAGQKSYMYQYDKLNRLSKASYLALGEFGWYNVTGENDGFINYDLNGNIKHLSRYGSMGSKIDDLQYDYNNGSSVGNQLQGVTDHTSNAMGFNNGNTNGSDYVYDDNGNLNKDLNKNITGIVYNHLNLPTEITFNNSNVIRYIYDATGAKLKKEVVENGKTMATYYLSGIQYHTMEQGVAPILLDFIATTEGRVLPYIPMQVEPCATTTTTNMQSGPWIYQYNLTDHLGNVRLTLSSEIITDKYLATMENEVSMQEDTVFLNLATHRSIQQAYNATEINGCTEITNANEVVIVANTTDNTQVPAKSLMVQRGDEVYVEVKAKYFEDPSTSNPAAIANMAGAVISSMGGSVGIETQSIRQSSHEISAIRAVANSTSSTVPPAALIMLVYDQDYNQIGDPIVRPISEAAKVTPENPNQPHETLGYTLLVDQPGYVYIYLWNESSTIVYFDDWLVEHQHGKVVQADDYYPFGLAMQPREDFENKYLYNGIELNTEIGLGVYTAKYRTLDPTLGRWWQVDPEADKFYSWSPYNSNFNNSIRYSDPNGDCPMCTGGDDIYSLGAIVQNNYGTWQYAGGGQWIDIAINQSNYFYTRQDLQMRNNLLRLGTGNVITAYMLRLEQQGKFGPLTSEGFYNQYTAKWGTNSAFWLGAGEYMPYVFGAGSVQGGKQNVTPKQFSLKYINSDVPDELVTLYRNFGWNEYNSIKELGGKFSISPNQYQGKQFWIGESGLTFWNKTTLSKPITAKVTIPRSYITPGNPNYIFQETIPMIDGYPGGTVLPENLSRFNNVMNIEYFIY